jgi:hypothetical protein
LRKYRCLSLSVHHTRILSRVNMPKANTCDVAIFAGPFM